jgi:Bacterial Ig domain
MRVGVAVALLLAAVLLAAPAGRAGADDGTCDTGTCGPPKCFGTSVRVRPGLTRSLSMVCENGYGAQLIKPPDHSTLSDLRAAPNGAVYFKIRPDDDAPRWDKAVLRIHGVEDGDVPIEIEVVPREENSPPVCEGATVKQWSDGVSRAQFLFHNGCRDPDGDEFTMYGSAPGDFLGPDGEAVEAESPGTTAPSYFTKAYSGHETLTLWAVDSLGARSADARIDVAFGPDVDNDPTCYGVEDGRVMPIFTRPGIPRHFWTWCVDDDGDSLGARVGDSPLNGTITDATADGGPLQATYNPVGPSLDPDPFSINLSDGRGGSFTAHFKIVPRPDTENEGPSCGVLGHGWAPFNTTTEFDLPCNDPEGDPMSAVVVKQPLHGTAVAGGVTNGTFPQATTLYTPASGFVGVDYFVIRISDDHGASATVGVPFETMAWGGPSDVTPPEVPVPPPAAPSGDQRPPAPPAAVPPVSGKGGARKAVERALGTHAVIRVSASGGMQAWARSRLSRTALLKLGSAPGMVVICAKGCGIHADSRMATGLSAARAPRARLAAAATPNQPQVLSVTISRDQQRALRRAVPTRATFRVSVRPKGGHRRTLRHSMPVRG